MPQNDIWITHLAVNLDEREVLRYQIQMPKLGQFWSSCTKKNHIFPSNIVVMPLTQCVNCIFNGDSKVSDISDADLLIKNAFREGAKMGCFKGLRHLINRDLEIRCPF
jgi:hypothetical protein